ncbi:MAG: hypothetical protein JRH20_15685, partial [Deltaproteobacteria bacterium]|nr:hypothetical protein [Deltaproteobacteria bacterium]
GDKGAELLHEAGARLVIRGESVLAPSSSSRRRNSSVPWLQLDDTTLPFGRGALDVLIAEVPKQVVELVALMREAARVLSNSGLLVLDNIEPSQMAAARSQVSHLFAHVVVYGQHALHAEQLVEQGRVGHHEPLVLFDELAWLPGSAPHYVLFASFFELPELERNALFTLPPSVTPSSSPQLQGLREQVSSLEQTLAEREREMLRMAGSTAHNKRLEREVLETQRSLELAKDALAGARERVASHDGELRRQRASVSGLERELEDAHREREDLRARALEAEQAATQVALELDRVSAERERIVGGQLELRDSHEKLQADYQQALERVELRRLDEDSASRRLERTALTMSELREQIERAQEQHAALLVDRDRLREELMAEQERQQGVALQRARLEQQLDGVREDVVLLKDRLEKGRQEEQDFALVRAEVSRLQRAEEVLRQELSELQQERRETMVALREQRRARLELERDLERQEEQTVALKRKEEEQRVALEEQLHRRLKERDGLRGELVDLEEQLRLAQTAQSELLSERAARQALEESRQRSMTLLEEERQEIRSLQEALSGALEKDRDHAQEIRQLSADLQAHDPLLKGLEGRVEQLLKELDEERCVVFELESSSAQLRRDLFVARETQNTLRQGLEEAHEQREAIRGQATQALADADGLHEQQLTELSEQLTVQAAAYELEIDVRAHELGVAMTQLDQLQENAWHGSDAASRHAARLAAAQASAENQRQEHAELLEKIEELSKQRRELEEQLHEAQRQQTFVDEGAVAQIVELQEQLEHERSELAHAGGALKQAEGEQREVEARLDKAQHAHESALERAKKDALGRQEQFEKRAHATREQVEQQATVVREQFEQRAVDAREKFEERATASREKFEERAKASRDQFQVKKSTLEGQIDAQKGELRQAKKELEVARKKIVDTQNKHPSGGHDVAQRSREKLMGERLERVKQQRDEARERAEVAEQALQEKRQELSALYGKAAAQQEREKELKRIKHQLERAGLALTDELGRTKVMADEMRRKVADRDSSLSAAKHDVDKGQAALVSELEQKLVTVTAKSKELAGRLAEAGGGAEPGSKETDARVQALNLKLSRVAREAARTGGLEQRIETQRGDFESLKRRGTAEREEQESQREKLEQELIVVERGRQRERVKAERALAQQTALKEMVIRLQEEMQGAGLITQAEPFPNADGEELHAGEPDDGLESDEWGALGEGRSGEGPAPVIPMAALEEARASKKGQKE